MHLKEPVLLPLLLLPAAVLSLPEAAPTPDASPAPNPSPGPEPSPGPNPDLLAAGGPHIDPEDPDFSGVVDFSNATPGPDGSWCITKVKYVDHMESDQVKECWHQNVTQCHDTYITEFLPSQEQKCEESFWKSCKIDFKEMPFNYTLKQCHTPLMKQCDEALTSYGVEPKTVCRTWFESECNTTYVETKSGAHKPNTWCQKMPRKICAPDNCEMVQGAEDCRDKTMVSTIQKPEEHCELQPQSHCRLITKLVPHLTTKEVCKQIPKEICVLQLVNPHPVKKPIQLKWCTKKKGEAVPVSEAQPQYSPLPEAAQAPPTSYLPASQPSPNFSEQPPPSYDSFARPVRGDNGQENQVFEFEQLRLPQSINHQGPHQHLKIRQQRRAFETMKPLVSQRKRNVDHVKQLSQKEMRMLFEGTEQKLHVVDPKPGATNAHMVNEQSEAPFINMDIKKIDSDSNKNKKREAKLVDASSDSTKSKMMDRQPKTQFGSSLRNHPSSFLSV